MKRTPSTYCLEIAPLTVLHGRRDPLFRYASKEKVMLGSLVSISFGRQMISGVVWSCQTLTGRVPHWMKYVGPVLLPAWLTPKQRVLAHTVSQSLFTPLGIVLKLFFPVLKQPRKKRGELQETQSLQTKQQKLPSGLTRRSKTLIQQEGLENDQAVLTRLVTLGLVAHRKKQLLLVLVPEVLAVEILAERLRTALPTATIDTLSSARTPREQYQIFQAVRSNTVTILIGTRQSVFVPLQSLFAIAIIDPEKRLSFHQWEMAPRYDAVAIAESISHIHHVPCYKLSVAPGLAYFTKTTTQKFKKQKPFEFSPEQSLTTLDLRKEWQKQKKQQGLSTPAIKCILEATQHKQSVLLLVKQRGVARFSICSRCGQSLRCPDCGTPLTESADGRYRCLTSGYRTALFPSCPDCGHMQFRSFGAGTNHIVRSLHQTGQISDIIVLDRDTTTQRDNFRTLISILSTATKPLVIVSTYELAESLILPPLGLIVMIEPDQGLYYPDYQSEERLWRMTRRFGGKLAPQGCLLVQTFQPEVKYWTNWVQDPLMKTADLLLDERQMLHYPPYWSLIQLECFPDRKCTSKKRALAIEHTLRSLAVGNAVIDPPYLPFNRKNRYHILIRLPESESLAPDLMRALTNFDQYVHITINPHSLNH